MKQQQTIRIIFPSSISLENILDARREELEKNGFRVLTNRPRLDPAWPYSSASIEDRSAELINAVLDPEAGILLCARGGWGASDLLSRVPWAQMKNARPKIIIGFSDISAIHSAFYKHLGWKSIHGPMPLTNQWDEHPDGVGSLLQILRKERISQAIALQPHSYNNKVEGPLFGGCLSVLTNLIGTGFLPDLKDHIVFFEDIGEHPARITRFLNQWVLSKSLKGVKGIVLGDFGDLQMNNGAADLAKELRKRLEMPVFTSMDFGHQKRNVPLGIGAHAVIQNQELTWKWGHGYA
ncbi:MAG: LD-carboxypeptidase [Oligoflexales bacterium]